MKLVQQISFTVESIAVLKEFREILEAEGLPIDSISTHGNAASVYFRDPKGNRLEVYYSIPVEWPQPFRKPINLDQDDDAVLQQIHDLTFGATVK
jgi:catechol-2,3-dioxygenase